MSKPSNEVYARYNERTARRYSLKLNINTDADVIEKLESVDSMQGYIKELIRKDLKAQD